MKKLLLTLVLFSALFTTQAQPVYACSCVIPGTPQEEMEKSDAVFSGTVTKVENAVVTGYDVTLQVLQTWKGSEDSLIQVNTGMGGGDCGFTFEEGVDYVVYASLTDGELHVYSCSLTGILAESNTDGLGDGTVISEVPNQAPEWIYAGVALGVLLAAIAYAVCKKR